MPSKPELRSDDLLCGSGAVLLLVVGVGGLLLFLGMLALAVVQLFLHAV
jgi:hypothetical protein